MSTAEKTRTTTVEQSRKLVTPIPGPTSAALTKRRVAAVSSAVPADRIVVFGSFLTVGGVLQDGVPRLQAKHLSS